MSFGSWWPQSAASEGGDQCDTPKTYRPREDLEELCIVTQDLCFQQKREVCNASLSDHGPYQRIYPGALRSAVVYLSQRQEDGSECAISEEVDLFKVVSSHYLVSLTKDSRSGRDANLEAFLVGLHMELLQLQSFTDQSMFTLKCPVYGVCPGIETHLPTLMAVCDRHGYHQLLDRVRLSMVRNPAMMSNTMVSVYGASKAPAS